MRDSIRLKHIRLIALDIDGPCLVDTFSPVIRKLVLSWGADYTSEIEANVFSQNRNAAAHFLIKRLDLEMTPDELIQLYFRERGRYESEAPHGPVPGLGSFLERVSGIGAVLVCYGGLDESYFRRELGEHARHFDRYICTNDFRPGVKEIPGMLGLNHDQALFVDDVARVGAAARDLGAPFVGIPARFAWGHQRRMMLDAGYPMVLEEIGQITREVLASIDEKAGAGTFWG